MRFVEGACGAVTCGYPQSTLSNLTSMGDMGHGSEVGRATCPCMPLEMKLVESASSAVTRGYSRLEAVCHKMRQRSQLTAALRTFQIRKTNKRTCVGAGKKEGTRFGT